MLFTKYKIISSEWDISKGCFLPLHLSAEVSTILREERTEIYQTSKDEMASRSEGNVFHHFLPISFLLFFSRSVLTLHDPMDCSTQASLSFTISRSLLQLMATVSDAKTISSSVVPFSSRLQYFPTSGAFLMSQFFTSGGLWVGLPPTHTEKLEIKCVEYFPESISHFFAPETVDQGVQHGTHHPIKHKCCLVCVH